MDEELFRGALHATMNRAAEPPPMSSAPVIEAGHRVVRRRWAIAGAGAAVALLAVTVLPVRLLSGSPESAPIEAAGPVVTPTPSTIDGVNHVPPPAAASGVASGSASGSSPASAPADVKPSWPAEASGDATADSGPHYQRGKDLLDLLLAVVPAGYQKPEGEAANGIPFRSHQAAIQNPEWTYLVSAAIRKDGGTGQLLVEVHEPGNHLPTDPCRLATSFWSFGGDCRVVTVGKVKVGVATPTGADQRVDQWAAYRYPDGTVVYAAQARAADFDPAGSGLPSLTALPFDTAGLAALAADERFHP